MIVKIVKHQNFSNLLKYLLEKEGSSLVGGNTLQRDLDGLIREFQSFLYMRDPRVKNTLTHISLSLPPGELVDDLTWSHIAYDFLQELGYTQNQYLVVKHTDREHPHIHIAVSRIQLDGKCTPDWWDFTKAQEAARKLEAQYYLSAVPHNPQKRSPKVGEVRIARTENQPSVRTILQDTIDEIAPQVSTIPTLATKLKERDIETRFKYNDEGEVLGISFGMAVVGREKPVALKGSQLGSIYSYEGLQRHFQLSPVSVLSALETEPELDAEENKREKLAEISTEGASEPELLKSTQDGRATTQPDRSYEVDNSQEEDRQQNLEPQSRYTDDQKIQFTGKIASQVLRILDKKEFGGERYTAQWQNQELTVIRNENGQEMLRAKYDYENEQWIAQQQHQISDADIEQLRRLRLELLKVMEAQEKQRKAVQRQGKKEQQWER